MARLQIYDRRERALVSAADYALAAPMGLARLLRSRRRPSSPQRILLLRLERIGDLLMTLPAIADVRAAAPDARIDLVVGRWNAGLAGSVRVVDRVDVLDAAWLAREGGGLGLGGLLRAARRWRTERYDLAINFEPDVRSNLLLAASGAGWTAGFASGGGGALLDQALEYDVRAHTTANSRRLAGAAMGARATGTPAGMLTIDSPAGASARSLTERAARPLVGIHVSGGRAIKQWPPERFAEVGRQLHVQRGATIVLTGSAADRPLVARARALLPAEAVLDLGSDADLPTLAALLQQLDLYVTGDTGPMHLAAAVGTPIVAVFGPSDPARYAPHGPHDRVVRVDLPCAPCNRIRLPPARCVGHTPDCLDLISTQSVTAAALSVLDAAGSAGRTAGTDAMRAAGPRPA